MKPLNRARNSSALPSTPSSNSPRCRISSSLFSLYTHPVRKVAIALVPCLAVR